MNLILNPQAFNTSIELPFQLPDLSQFITTEKLYLLLDSPSQLFLTLAIAILAVYLLQAMIGLVKNILSIAWTLFKIGLVFLLLFYFFK